MTIFINIVADIQFHLFYTCEAAIHWIMLLISGFPPKAPQPQFPVETPIYSSELVLGQLSLLLESWTVCRKWEHFQYMCLSYFRCNKYIVQSSISYRAFFEIKDTCSRVPYLFNLPSVTSLAGYEKINEPKYGLQCWLSPYYQYKGHSEQKGR